MSESTIKRERLRARAWMVMQKMRVKDIQKALGHKYPTVTVETLSGLRNHRKVLGYLLEQGCPEEFLNIPNDMKGLRR